MITFVCWKWLPRGYRVSYTAEHVNKWAAGIRRHYKGDCRLICVTDDPKDIQIETFPLWNDHSHIHNPSGEYLPSCFRRLKIFSPDVTAEMDIEYGAPVVSIDLDVLFTGPLNRHFDNQTANFVGWKGRGTYNAVVYNGTIFMFRAGKCESLWKDFDPRNSPRLAKEHGYFGSDQGWLSYKLNGSAPGWTPRDGIVSYVADVFKKDNKLTPNISIVSFNGKFKPWDANVLKHSPWVREHWRL